MNFKTKTANVNGKSTRIFVSPMANYRRNALNLIQNTPITLEIILGIIVEIA